MSSKLQVFISSTFLDLRDERQAAVEAILRAGHLPAGMELFTAGDKSQWQVIQRWIQESDIYMLILGGRYGSIEPESGLSYTELEYDLAHSLGKPTFAVVISDKALAARSGNPKIPFAIEIENLGKLQSFKKKVLSKISSFFEDSKDVKLTVHESLPRILAENQLKGWIRASDVPDTKQLADKILELHNENKSLREQLSHKTLLLEKSTSAKQIINQEFDEIWELLAEATIDISDFKDLMPSEKTNKLSVLLLLHYYKDDLLNGITNEFGMSKTANFLYFTLCPSLQVHELVAQEKVTGVKYRRYAISKRGAQFLAYAEKRVLQLKKAAAGGTQNQTK